jgi:hypothetical protein
MKDIGDNSMMYKTLRFLLPKELNPTLGITHTSGKVYEKNGQLFRDIHT